MSLIAASLACSASSGNAPQTPAAASPTPVDPAKVVWLDPGEVRVVVVGRDAMPLPGVTVYLIREPAHESQRIMVTDPKGRAGFAGVAAGDYSIRFELSGFVSCSIGPVRMRASRDQNPQLPEFVVMMNPEAVF